MTDPVELNNEEEIKIVKVFINNVDMYQSKAICSILNEDNDGKKQNYKIYGTVNNMKEAKMKTIKQFVNEILYPGSLDYICDIINCDIIIYDIGSDLTQINEVEQVLDVILNKVKEKNPENDINNKYFILISNPLTWAKTKKLNDDNILYENDYRKRCAHPNYLKHKCIEREVNMMEKRTRCKLRTLVVCPGLTYGGSNDIFHYIFKTAFYNKDKIPIIEPGNQILPVIYINDFARIIKQLVENFPQSETRYVFAVEPKFRKIKSFTRQIANSLGGTAAKTQVIKKGEILKQKSELFEQRVIDAIVTEMKISPTYFQNFAFTFTDEEFGNKLAEEFRIERGLLPIKILIDGPPCVGKTTIANLLCNYYNLNYISMDTLLSDSIKYYESNMEEAKAFINNLKKERIITDDDKDDESITYISEAEKNIEDWSAKLQELLNYIDKDIGDKFELVKKIFTEKLLTKICNENQGYVIDGFPYDYTEANELFRPSEENDENNNNNNIKPSHVVILDAPNDIIIARAMTFDDESAEKNGYTEEEMGKNIEKYRERNEEDKSLTSFFHDINIIPLMICINSRTKIAGILDIIKHEIGPTHTYPISREQLQQAQDDENQKRAQETEELNRAHEELRIKIKAEREAKLKKWTKEFEKLKSEEEATIEAKTLPLRYYLSKFVLPTLTEGILKTAEIKPDDPVDFLAEYFFKYNNTGHVLPSSYNEELKELLLTEGKDDITSILKELAHNENEFRCSK